MPQMGLIESNEGIPHETSLTTMKPIDRKTHVIELVEESIGITMGGSSIYRVALFLNNQDNLK